MPNGKLNKNNEPEVVVEMMVAEIGMIEVTAMEADNMVVNRVLVEIGAVITEGEITDQEEWEEADLAMVITDEISTLSTEFQLNYTLS